jgi:signal transduction histidine kinase
MPSVDRARRWWLDQIVPALRSRVAVESRARLLWAVRVRWLVVAGFFLLALVAARTGLLVSVRPCAQAAVVAALVNALNHWCVRRGRGLAAVTALAVPGDVLLITYVVVHTGGVGSPFLMMYVVQVVATAMLVDVAVAAVAALACVGGFLGATRLQRLGLVGEARFGLAAGIEDPVFQAVWSLFLLYCLGLLAYLAGYISERLRDSERRLAQRTRDLEKALESLRSTHADLAATHERLLVAEAQLVQSEKMRAVGQFVAGIAHELNNPISFVAGNIEHLERIGGALREMLGAYDRLALGADERHALAERRRALRLDELLDDLPAALADCREGARRAKEIVAALQAFSRGDPIGRWAAADLRDGLERTLSLLRPRLKGIAVERDLEPIPAIECMAGQLDQVFLNLLTNAVDAVGASGRLKVRTRLETDGGGEEYVAVRIEDDGVGIAADVQSRIFDPFFTTKSPGQGTGLGLSVSYGIVERHGGTLGVESAPGRGSVFTVRLPVRRRSRPPAQGCGGRGGKAS